MSGQVNHASGGISRHAIADFGHGKSLDFCIAGPCKGAITTEATIAEPKGSEPRWLFSEAARALGLNPDTIKRGSPEHARVTAVLDTLVAGIAKAAPAPGKSIAETHSDMRQKIAVAVRASATVSAMGVTANGAAATAHAPGMGKVVEILSKAPNIDKVADAAAGAIKRNPATVAAAAAGTVGAVIAINMAGEKPTPVAVPDATPMSKPRPADAPAALQVTDAKTKAAIAESLDPCRDGEGPVHHKIPAALTTDFAKFYEQIGYTPNDPNNVIRLAKNEAQQTALHEICTETRPLHRGPHTQAYEGAVRSQLDGIRNALGEGRITAVEARESVNKLMNGIDNMLRSGEYANVNDAGVAEAIKVLEVLPK